MTLAEARTICNSWLTRVPKDALIVALVLFASLASFGLGFLVGQEEGSGVSVSQVPLEAAAASALSPATLPAASQVVASRNGSKYYFPWCSGAKAISPANLVTFASAAAAQAKGYTPAANCKGL